MGGKDKAYGVLKNKQNTNADQDYDIENCEHLDQKMNKWVFSFRLKEACKEEKIHNIVHEQETLRDPIGYIVVVENKLINPKIKATYVHEGHHNINGIPKKLRFFDEEVKGQCCKTHEKTKPGKEIVR